ncbi:hypothetical protein FXW36_02990 (plasmid) [Rhodococcus opacus]|uniref:hypothetical protein n=1 Tax=Rhodococcus opacus TaxID=37919 RepID=UPI0016040F39|nr:hypothetical protein [Rhodococcus opacus]QZS52572.1 hypothetical protein FXW36_02990 [Rhodococcus opacus]
MFAFADTASMTKAANAGLVTSINGAFSINTLLIVVIPSNPKQILLFAELAKHRRPRGYLRASGTVRGSDKKADEDTQTTLAPVSEESSVTDD